MYRVNNIRIDESIHILILGDSHTMSGIDDSIIMNSLNISQSSEHFLYSYNVLRQLLDNNSQIDRVILGVGFHSFSKSYDQQIQNKASTIIRVPRYYPILDQESIMDINMDFNKFLLKQRKDIFKSIVKSSFMPGTISDFLFIGGFYKSERTNLSDSTANVAIQRHYFTESGTLQDYAVYQVKYLKKIVELCKVKNISLIFINTPVHDKYFKNIPEKFLDNYYSTIQQFSNGINIYDLHSVKFAQDCYGDGDHLNSKGAKKLSFIISERIDAEIQTRPHKGCSNNTFNVN